MRLLAIVVTMSIGLTLVALTDARAQSAPPHGTITTDSPGISPHLRAFRRAITPGRVYAQLHEYRGRYVLYAPCDGGAGPTLTISRRALYEYFDDGPAKTAVKKLPTRTGCTMYITGTPGDTLKFWGLNGGGGMTILERTLEENAASRFMLLASTKSLQKYPVVKLHCITGRLREVEFDEIDFASIMSGIKR